MNIVRLHPSHMRAASVESYERSNECSESCYSASSLSNFRSESSCGGIGSTGHPTRHRNVQTVNRISAESTPGPAKIDEKTLVPALESSREEKFINGRVLPYPRTQFMKNSIAMKSIEMNQKIPEIAAKLNMVHAESQTRPYNMMKVYLPGIKEHNQWCEEKANPFIEVRLIFRTIFTGLISRFLSPTFELKLQYSQVMRKEILKNKPAKIEEYVIVLCKSRQEGTTTPVSVVVTRPTLATISSGERSNLAKLRQSGQELERRRSVALTATLPLPD
jgi:hypothetical protein